MLSSYSVAQGHIFWLTKPFEEVYYEDSDDERKGLRETFHGIERGVYGHPVMVLHKVAGTTDAAVCLLTTLKGRDHKEMYQFLYHHQSSYLAIHPTDPPCLLLHPPLHLVNDIKLRKPGYLSIKQRYIVRLEMLELYDRRYPASHYRLTPESFAIVASIFSIPVDTTATKKAGYDHGEEADGTPEIKISTTHREPDSGGERPLLVAAVMETARLSHRGKPDETQFGPEFKVSTTHREPTFDGEIPPLATTKPSATPQNEPERDTAEPSSTYPGFLEGKTATASRLHPQSLTSDGVKALILGAMMKFGENLEALKTILRKDKA